MEIDDWPTYQEDLTKHLLGEGDLLNADMMDRLILLLPTEDNQLAITFVNEAQKIFEAKTNSLMKSGQFLTQGDRTKMLGRLGRFEKSIDRALSHLIEKRQGSDTDTEGLLKIYLIKMLTLQMGWEPETLKDRISQSHSEEFAVHGFTPGNVRLIRTLQEFKDGASSLFDLFTQSGSGQVEHGEQPKKQSYPVMGYVTEICELWKEYFGEFPSSNPKPGEQFLPIDGVIKILIYPFEPRSKRNQSYVAQIKEAVKEINSRTRT